ncbi:DUF4352 domain-containing protein [Streptomyces sp. NPDC056529]|uniref:DUF4352 domain-containing protein n=1 Tax=Streptomyces sp. NPDC056529 TaxID=3345855 RepID=UPI0036A42445
MTTPTDRPSSASIPPQPPWAPAPAPRKARPWILPTATGLAGLITGGALTFAFTNNEGSLHGTTTSQASATPSHWVQPEISTPPVDPTPEPERTEEIEAGDRRIPLDPGHRQISTGEAVKTSKWALTVDNVQLDARETNEYIKADRDKEGKRKGVLTVSVTNLTQASRKFDVRAENILYVLDQDGNDSSVHGLIEIEQVDVFEKNIKAGATVKGLLQFDYYKDATAFRILVCEAQAPANQYQGTVVATLPVPSATHS